MTPEQVEKYSYLVPERSNVLLVAPTLVNEAPVTLMMLGGVFKEQGFEVSAAVNTFGSPLSRDDFVAAALKDDCRIVAISMLTIQVLNTYALVKAFKDAGMIVVLGGPHPTDCPEEGIDYGADIVVRGEGEETLRELCRYWKGESALALEEIAGITFRNAEGQIVSTEDREPVRDLSTLPPLNFDIIDEAQFQENEGPVKGYQRIFTSRGCPGQCTYCDNRVFCTLSYYPVEETVKEIKRRVEEYGITSFSIADDNFTSRKKHVYAFCEELAKIDHKVSWRVNSRANLVDPEMLKTMREAGCHLISFGTESGDVETLKRIKKGISLEQNLKAPFMAAEAGLQVFVNMMTGFPWETPESVQRTIDFIEKISSATFLFQVAGSIVPFPGTAMYQEYAEEYGFENYWLKEDYQHIGIQIYQNHPCPYSVSTFYQRHLFDDSFIRDDLFFRYSPEYKKKVKELVFAIGRHNLRSLYPGDSLKQNRLLWTSRLSYGLYDLSPQFEKSIGRQLFGGKRVGVEKKRDRANPEHRKEPSKTAAGR